MRITGPDRLGVLVLSLAVGGLLFQLLPAPAAAAAHPTPILSLRLDAASQAVPVTESAPCIVRFTGQLSIDKLPACRCFVTLTSSVDAGWVSQVVPLTTVFTSTTPQPFACTVVVPQGTPVNRSGSLVVRGIGNTGGTLSIAETRGTIAAEPYFRVRLAADRPIMTIVQGEQCQFTVWTRNDGNAPDSFEMEICDLRELADSGWTVVIVGGTVPDVQPGESKPVRLTARSSQEAWTTADSLSTIRFKVTSRNARDLQQVVSDNITLTTQVRASWHRQSGISFLPPAILLLAGLCAVFVALDKKIVKRWR